MSTPQDRFRSSRALVALAVLAALGLGGYYALRGLRPAEIGAALHRARPLPLVAAALAALAMQACRGLFWRLALKPPRPIALPRFVRYTILGNAASALLPARAGEAVRVWLLVELDGVQAVDAVGAALAERALDVASMVLVLAPLPLLLPGGPPWVIRTLALLGVAGAAIVVAVAVIARRTPRGDGLLARLARALSQLSSWPRLGAGIAVLTLAWLFDLGALILVGHALGLSLPPAAPFLVLLTVNLAIAVPAAPAQLGSHEAGTLLALALLHTPRAEAVAFALLYHAAHVLPLLAAAALDAPLLYRGLAGVNRRRAAPSRAP